MKFFLTPAITTTILAIAGCHPGGRIINQPGKKCLLKEDSKVLNPENFNRYFKKKQAAYYIEEGENLLLAIRIKKSAEIEEVIGRFFSLIITKFDFHCDSRKKIIIVCYKGYIEEKNNIGMLLDVKDITKFQDGVLSLDELSERIKYVKGLNLSSVKPLLIK